MDALARMAVEIHSRLNPSCELLGLGDNEYGRHDICAVAETVKKCTAITYGVENEYTFELKLRERFGCDVFALDPTVNHPAELARGVYFLKWGAPSAWLNRKESAYIIVSPVEFAALVAPGEHIQLLKMDCEGCEFEIFRDVLEFDPTWFERVRQVALEVHLSKSLGLDSIKALYGFGHLLQLLEKSGHELQHVRITNCDISDESSGVMPQLLDMGFARDGEGHCHNYLFARNG